MTLADTNLEVKVYIIWTNNKGGTINFMDKNKKITLLSLLLSSDFNLNPNSINSSKDPKDWKESKDHKEHKDHKDCKDHKEHKDHKDCKDHKDHKDHKEHKDHKDCEGHKGYWKKEDPKGDEDFMGHKGCGCNKFECDCCCTTGIRKKLEKYQFLYTVIVNGYDYYGYFEVLNVDCDTVTLYDYDYYGTIVFSLCDISGFEPA
ncbi:hypothetical protein [Priestia megaterium]|uniref:hypothetical protein n=1 Tax=Priestia megaterium TaxID=1404 RepID=UPI001643067F|nr:hypothetical protein [Priestia megaterium]